MEDKVVLKLKIMIHKLLIIQISIFIQFLVLKINFHIVTQKKVKLKDNHKKHNNTFYLYKIRMRKKKRKRKK